MGTLRMGETPVHVFDTDVDLRKARVYVTYDQYGKTILEKTNEDMDIQETYVSVTLTQAETLRFKANSNVEIQLRWVFENGVAAKSDIFVSKTDRLLKGGVIEWQ